MMKQIVDLSFGQPWWLLLLLWVPVIAWLSGRAGGAAPAIKYSSIDLIRRSGLPVRRARRGWLSSWMLAAFAAGAVAMARPRLPSGELPEKKKGVDIVFCADISGSMEAKDFIHSGRKVSRREALGIAIGDFVDKRPNDRFGMIGFAGFTYLMSPLTLDGQWIKGMLKTIRPQSGTAIGDGILGGVELLKESKSTSKILVVVTDGQNNAGTEPLKAADSARAAGVRVYTIGITSPGLVSSDAAVKSVLAKVADRTGGQYFQASSLERLNDAYRQIDRLETTPFEQPRHQLYDELHPYVIAASFLLLLVGFVGSHTVWMRIP